MTNLHTWLLQQNVLRTGDVFALAIEYYADQVSFVFNND